MTIKELIFIDEKGYKSKLQNKQNHLKKTNMNQSTKLS